MGTGDGRGGSLNPPTPGGTESEVVYDGFLYEVPEGLPARPEESGEECAHRELEEEPGMRTATITPFTRIYTYTGLYDTTPGFTTR